MMEWTDRHCRFFHRLLTRRALLYTEMLTTGAVLHGDRTRLLRFDAAEHPVALQLGGSDPRALAACARIGAELGFDEINLNAGCPSDRVQDGRFGACLMAEPALVAHGVAAMKRAVNIPVTVKCRLGIDDQDPEIALDALARSVVAARSLLVNLVSSVVTAGCPLFWLNGWGFVAGGSLPVAKTYQYRNHQLTTSHQSRLRSDWLCRQAVKSLFQVSILAGQLGRLAVEDDLAVVDEQHAVRDRLDLLENVSRDQHGLRLTQVTDQLADDANLVGVEPARGFVHDQYFWVMQ